MILFIGDIPVAARSYIYLVLAFMMIGFSTSCANRERLSDPSSRSAGNVPPVLLRIDEKAEQIVPAATEGDWPRVYAYVQDINDAWLGYQDQSIEPEREPLTPPGALLAQRFGEALYKLKEAASERSSSKTAKAANDVSAAAVNMYEYYHPAVPVDLRKLEILERRILIEASSDSFDSASTILSNAHAVWLLIQPTLRDRAGDKVVQEIGGELDRQQTALTAQDRALLTASVETTIQMIDDVQTLY
jgi:hypothetical protein